MRASPELVSIYNAARAEYADAIYAWWHASAVRERYDTPTDLDYELVKLDPRVRRAERALQAVDAQLSANAQPVKTATLRNDGSARRTMMDETERIDAEWRAAQQQQEKRTRKRRRKTVVDPVPVSVPPLPDATVEAAAALTPASIASTARTSLSADIPSDHYSATSPEPEDDDASDTDAYVPSWKVKVDAAAAAGPSNLSLKRRKAA
ncbi:hypothetical protein EXIGLDRAFT_729160 [Exidia glandulosa HHB12029]|uniref:Uncharacterized protein n=1 Tax=Exidia glandulosa HHB12029 TaxID=1314781 RepID=A0A165LKR8_EXIGL|nr:hypothetical protein EXIGLDRAFT_729160 [Exidia glandulosa HHB12029]